MCYLDTLTCISTFILPIDNNPITTCPVILTMDPST